jgi:general secretion pathway protein K
MALAAPGHDRNSSGGFILIAVLWILGGLAVLAAIYTLYVVNTASSRQVGSDRLQADASISAALELTAYYIGAVKPPERPTSGSFNFRAGNAAVAVAFVSEAARVDLNFAPQPLLAGLFRTLGAAPDAAEVYAGRVVGWRSPAVSQNVDLDPGKETTDYRNAGRGYDPRLAPFVNVQELWLLLGLPPALVERALGFVTVFSGLPTVNVMDAAPEIVAALPGMTPERLDAILAQRAVHPVDANRVLQMLGPAQASATALGGNATRVKVQVLLADGRRVNAEAVILLLEDAPDPYRVLSWTDDFDG